MSEAPHTTGLHPLIAALRAEDPLFDALIRFQEGGWTAVSNAERGALYRRGLIQIDLVTL